MVAALVSALRAAGHVGGDAHVLHCIAGTCLVDSKPDTKAGLALSVTSAIHHLNEHLLPQAYSYMDTASTITSLGATCEPLSVSPAHAQAHFQLCCGSLRAMHHEALQWLCRSGFLQGSFFFLYMLMVSYSWFLLLGTVGWRASLLFVRHIYRCCPALKLCYR